MDQRNYRRLGRDLYYLMRDYAHTGTHRTPHFRYAVIHTGYTSRLLGGQMDASDWYSPRRDDGETSDGTVRGNKEWLRKRKCMYLDDDLWGKGTYIVDPARVREVKDIRAGLRHIHKDYGVAVFRCTSMSEALQIVHNLETAKYCRTYGVDDIEYHRTPQGRGYVLITVDAESG